MAFQTFNQGAVQSAYIGYKKYTQADFDANFDLKLYWSNAGQLIPSNQLMAQFMDIRPDEAVNVYLPPADQVGIGTNFIIANNGLNSIVVVDTISSTQFVSLNSINPGQTIYYVLKKYEYVFPEKRWEYYNFASTTSAPIVGNLAGYGLAFDSDNNDLMTNVLVQGINDPVGLEIFKNDRAKFFVWTSGSGPFKLMPSTLLDGWYCSLLNLGSGLITIELPDGATIDGEANKLISLKQSLTIVSDGDNYYTLGYGQQQTNITIPLSIVNGGTGASNQANAIKNLMPTATATGQIVYYNGTNWLTFNNPSTGGTQVLTNDNTGNLAWQFRYPLPVPGSDGNLLISNLGAWTILPPGAEGNVLKIVGGIPTWTTP